MREDGCQGTRTPLNQMIIWTRVKTLMKTKDLGGDRVPVWGFSRGKLTQISKGQSPGMGRNYILRIGGNMFSKSAGLSQALVGVD